MAKTQIIRNEVNKSKKFKTNDDAALARGGKAELRSLWRHVRAGAGRALARGGSAG